MGPSCTKEPWAMTTGTYSRTCEEFKILTFASLRKIIRRNEYVC
jgi:hypothetical protein